MKSIIDRGKMSNTNAIEVTSRRKAALVFIFVTVLLDVLSLGVTIPVSPSLITTFCDGDHKLGMFYNGWFVTTWAAMQFIFSPLIGAMSDRFGRRRVILLSCTGLGLDYILMALAPNLTWLFIGRVLSGITAASFSTAAAYIADITPPEKRAASYGIFGAAFGLGFVIGPALGGLLSVYGLRIPFWVAAGLTLLSAAYGFWILPESLPAENRSKFSWKKANPVGSLKLLRSHPELLGLASVFFLYYLAHQVFQSVFVIYTNYRYGWEPQTVGLTLTAVGLASVFVQGFLVRRAAKRLGEWRMLMIALTFGMAGYLIYGLAPTGGIFWCAIPVFSLVGFFSAAIQGLMTSRVRLDEQGQLQGANSSIMGIAGMIGPTIFSFAFYRTSFTGLPFFLAASLHVLAILMVVLLARNQPPRVAVS
jgi:MFS transporter, DHA1 family, tetracycline resistance protein